MTTKPNLLDLAKQGNPKALAALLNQKLQPKGITAKTSLKNNCLHLMLEGSQIPPQEALVEFIRKGLTGLESLSFEKVKVYGKQTEEDFPAWIQEIKLNTEVSNTLLSSNQSIQVLDESKEKAINSLFNQGLERSNGQNREAIGLFTQVIDLDSNHTEAYFMRASNKRALEEYQDAIEDYNQAIKLKPNYGQAYYERGLIFFTLKEYQKTIEDNTQAFQYGINYASAYNRLVGE